MKTTLILFLFVTTHYIFSQKIFYQDICNCGVTGAGFSTALGSGSGSIVINIEPNSTIKKAYLFAHRFGLANDTTILFNNSLYLFNNQNRISSNLYCQGTFQAPQQSLHAIDVTNQINPNQNNYIVTIPNQNSCIGCLFGNVYLLIIYENVILSNSSISFYMNDKNDAYSCDYIIDTLNSISPNSEILLSIYSDRINDYEPFDGSIFTINNQQIGILKGTDNANINWPGGGVKGHFYFQNSTIFGLDDDNPALPFGGANGIIDLSQFNISNSINWNIKWETFEPPYNIFSGFIFAYTSPCTSFPVTTSPDTSVCKGSTLQLQASGGVQYEWLPFAGLSCSNCPNPIVQTDSSQFYTVRIWNNDSCSVVRPVHVTVYQPAKFSGISISPATCGEANGQLTATLSNTAYLPLSFSVNNAPFQNSSTYTKQFQNLPYGPLLLTAKDGHQCTIDTLLTIPYNNTCSALFTASPSTGATPLNVQFSNQSTNATNYAWEINATSLGSILNNHIFDTAGTYFVQLYAWQNIPECIDSFSVQIIVFDSLVVQVPNVFTVNNDGVNDVFSLSSNQQITVAYSIVNRWGTVVASGTSKSLPITNGVYTTTIWDGRNATNGVYFYTITLQSQGENKIVNGFVERLD